MSKSGLPGKFSFYLITQSLGAFNDNLYKMLLQLYALQVLSEQSARGVISDAAFVFTIPFVLFGPWSGYLADRYSKSRMMKIVKFAEIAVMSLGLLAFYLGNLPLMLAILFLMAGQSTFFSPAKYGYIPEVCRPSAVTRANSWVEMTTFAAIIVGTAVAGPLLDLHGNNVVTAAGYCLAIAIVGSLTSLRIPVVPEVGTKAKFPANPLRGIWDDLKFLTRYRGLFLTALANSYFWLLGLVFQTNILIYGKLMLQDHPAIDTLLSILPGFIGIGIATGSMLAARLSGGKVETGLVLFGGGGMALCGLALFFTYQSYWLSAAILFLAGGFGGIFIVPLYAYLQYYAHPDEKGRVMATAGIWNGFFLVLGAAIYRLLSVELSLHPRVIYLIMGLVTLAVLALLAMLHRELWERFRWWLSTRTIYRYRASGIERLPAHGGAILPVSGIATANMLRLSSAIQQKVQFIDLRGNGQKPQQTESPAARFGLTIAASRDFSAIRPPAPGSETLLCLIFDNRNLDALSRFLNAHPELPVHPLRFTPPDSSMFEKTALEVLPSMPRPVNPLQLKKMLSLETPGR